MCVCARGDCPGCFTAFFALCFARQARLRDDFLAGSLCAAFPIWLSGTAGLLVEREEEVRTLGSGSPPAGLSPSMCKGSAGLIHCVDGAPLP